MPFTYADFLQAQGLPGWRMVVVGGIPSPWSEAAKGILHVKGIAWTAVRLDYADEAMKAWAPQRSAPVAVYDDERPRSGWSEILLLAERVAPQPPLLPRDAQARAEAMGLAHEICGEQGLGWTRRLQLVQAGLQDSGGFPAKVAGYLARKYGYTPELGAGAAQRVGDLLRMLAGRLRAQQARGSSYYIGDALSAVDIYSATFLALVQPLPQDVCPMDPTTRAAFSLRDPVVDAALDPLLLAHREHMYREHLALPLSL